MKKYDVIVIGGGASGLMSAGKAGDRGCSVLLLEKNNRPGKKLLLTGGGRCNLTHEVSNNDQWMEILGDKGKFFLSSFSRFGVEETMNFFTDQGLPLKTQEDGRVFPRSDKAQDLLEVLLKYIKKGNVEILYNTSVLELKRKEDRIISVVTHNDEFYSNYVILSTGGKSYPQTGSTGDGFIIAEKLGHTVIPPRPALTPLIIKEIWVKNLMGISLKETEIEVLCEEEQENEKKKRKSVRDRDSKQVGNGGVKKKSHAIFKTQGEMLFTHFGITGPSILNISGRVGSLMERGTVILSVDIKPDLSSEDVEDALIKMFRSNPNKNIKNSLDNLFADRISCMLLSLSHISPERKNHSITGKERLLLTKNIKSLEMTVQSLKGFEQAMVTAGGIDLGEVDPRSMASRIIKNLYFCGEILDIDAPTGGYNLQLCWTTGYTTGSLL